MTDWRLGTIGFGYDDWRGPFYPSNAKAGDYLAFYARYFNAVELDTTFHATPPPDRAARWAAAVPDDFRFCPKAPRAVTHAEPALEGALAPMTDFLDAMRALGTKLGPVLLQFPPTFTADATWRLEEFLAALPTDVRYAVELRNRSWGTPRTLDLLRAHRCAIVWAEYLVRPGRLPVTTDFAYVRWIGQHGRYDHHDREQDDPTPALEWWTKHLPPVAREIATVYGFMNNDYAGNAVATCLRLKRMLGLPANEPTSGDKGQLFG